MNIPATPTEIALATAIGTVVGDVVSDFANNVSSAWDNIYQMAKGGNQNKDNEWSRPARLQPDPCAWLRDQYQKAGDSVTKQKIKTAQKVLGCRKNSSSNEDCK